MLLFVVVKNLCKPKLKYYHIYFASAERGLIGHLSCKYYKKGKLCFSSGSTPKMPKFTFFMVLTRKMLMCFIYSEPTQTGIILNIFMEHTQKLVKYAINIMQFILFLLKTCWILWFIQYLRGLATKKFEKLKGFLNFFFYYCN